MNTPVLVTAVALCLVGSNAQADRGALSMEGGAAPTLLWTPLRESAAHGRAPLPAATLSARYAWAHSIEVLLRGEWAPPSPAAEEGVEVRGPHGSAPLTGQMRWVTSGFSVATGVRLIRGLVWRPWVEVDVGYGRWSVTQQKLVDVKTPGGPYDFGLPLGDLLVHGIRAGLGIGLDWALADRWTLGVSVRGTAVLEPRLGIWLGAVFVPFTLAYAFYP